MSNNVANILKRSGTDQEERFVKALNPENFELHDFSIEDWILFAYNFAENVNYYAINDDVHQSGNWQCFFNAFDLENKIVPARTTKEYETLKNKISEVLTSYKKTHDLTPHLTLFTCFLQLLKFSKERFNDLTKRHLDFYYTSILQVDKLAPIEDQVHVLFELARKSSEEQIIEGTELNAQKDDDGNQRIYKTNEVIIVNRAKVASLKTVYNDPKLPELKASQVANTLDGLEFPLPEEAPYWYPFGYTSPEGDYTELEDAEIGFALSSPILNLKEGLRTITITIDFTDDITDLSEFSPEVLKEILAIYGSGEEDWVGPIEIITEDQEKENGDEGEENQKQLKLVFQLDRDSDALVNYNEEFLLKKYNTKFPVIRFLLKTNDRKGYKFYKAFTENSIEKITIKVAVKGAKEIVVENDTGVLKTAKPFYPFTTQPVKNSNFYINYPEVFSKSWSSLDVSLRWKNTPEDFKEWYKAYLKTQKLATTKNEFKIQMASISDNELIVTGDEYFTAKKAILHKEIWDIKAKEQILFSKVIDVEGKEEKEGQEEQKEESHFESTIQFVNSTYEIDKVSSVRLSLENTFLHELYPRLYALALTTDDSPLIPNEPYTPLIEEVSLNYVAEESIDVKSQVFPVATGSLAKENTEAVYDENRIKLFHEHPFGHHEEHNYLKITQREKGINDIYDTNNIHSYLLPKHCKGGELFIGLEEAEVSQTVSLLVQVLEGSENPLVPSFKEDEEIDWSVLCDGKWKNLKEHIISNNTDNFLTSGIIKISIPAEATKNNTLLPENFIWLRARMHKSYDAVCKVINIQAQAVVAEFENVDNNLLHLEKGLPAETIKKMITRIPQIKGLEQPYTSFDGLPEESDLNFYRRISERLRHKDRAITMWDYEHLILQEFPEIYKVKCLNHTYENNFTAAGEVTIVAIPDTVNKNVFDIYEPRLSRGLLNKVEVYINKFNAKYIKAKVINPNYEKVTISLEVKFHEGLDKSFYAKKIDEDIIKFLSPWAFDDTKEVAFGITLHRSVLIDYLEKLKYVDYLQKVKMKKEGNKKDEINSTPTDPRSILVSAKTHTIETNLTPCKGELKEEEIACRA